MSLDFIPSRMGSLGGSLSGRMAISDFRAGLLRWLLGNAWGDGGGRGWEAV